VEAARGKAEVEASVDLERGLTTEVILEAKVIMETKRKEILKTNQTIIKVIAQTIGVVVVEVIEEVVADVEGAEASAELLTVRTRSLRPTQHSVGVFLRAELSKS